MHKHYQHGRIRIVILWACLVTLFGIGIGLLMYAHIARLGDGLAIFVGGCVVVMLTVRLIVLQDQYDRKRHERQEKLRRCRERQPSASHTPVEFNHRLANYLHRPVDQIADPGPRYRSRMPFWCRVNVIRRFGPKSSKRIHEILERIRRAVHGRHNGDG